MNRVRTCYIVEVVLTDETGRPLNITYLEKSVDAILQSFIEAVYSCMVSNKEKITISFGKTHDEKICKN